MKEGKHEIAEIAASSSGLQDINIPSYVNASNREVC